MYLTIAVPSYNAALLLPRCLDSMAHARFEGRLEVLIVNDGSTDDTSAVAKEYVMRYPKLFRLLEQKNLGHGGAVNTGICEASGEYFRIVDADDWVDAAELDKLLFAMERLKPDVFLDERVLCREDTGTNERQKMPDNAKMEQMLDFSVITDKAYYQCISMHTLTPRTVLIRDSGVRLLENTYYVDMQYVIAVTAFARTVALVPAGVYHYRLGSAEQSVNPANYAKNYAQHDAVLHACVDYIENYAHSLPENREQYMRSALVLLTNTQYNIALIYNNSRCEGARQARELTIWLSERVPWLERATARRRCSASLLHLLGFNYTWLQRVKCFLSGKRAAK